MNKLNPNRKWFNPNRQRSQKQKLDSPVMLKETDAATQRAQTARLESTADAMASSAEAWGFGSPRKPSSSSPWNCNRLPTNEKSTPPYMSEKSDKSLLRTASPFQSKPSHQLSARSCSPEGRREGTLYQSNREKSTTVKKEMERLLRDFGSY